MALGIPLPSADFGGGLAKTSQNLFNQMLQKGIKDEDRKQSERHFEEQLKLSKAAAARAGAMDPLRRMILEQQLQGLKNKNDPMYEVNQMKALMGMLSGGQGGGQMPQEAAPTQEMGQGMGMFSPQGLADQSMPSVDNGDQTAPTAPNTAQGGTMDFTALRNNPMIRGLFKHKYGIDLGAETPDEKELHAVSRATSVAEAKSNIKKLDEIEKTAQALLPYVGKVNTIGEILERKPELAGRTTQLADFLGMTKDEDVGKFLSAAQALQAHMAKEMSSRGGYGVSKLVEQAKPNLGKSTAYNKGVIQELRQGMKESFEQMKTEYERLSGGRKFPYNFEQYFQAQTGGGTGSSQGGMVSMISPKGKKVMIPKEHVDAALASGGRLG